MWLNTFHHGLYEARSRRPLLHDGFRVRFQLTLAATGDRPDAAPGNRNPHVRARVRLRFCVGPPRHIRRVSQRYAASGRRGETFEGGSESAGERCSSSASLDVGDTRDDHVRGNSLRTQEVAPRTGVTAQTDRLNTALTGRYRIERYIGEGDAHAKLAGKAPK